MKSGHSLQWYQDSLLFFLLTIFLGGIGLSFVEWNPHLSHPLKVHRNQVAKLDPSAQEDGGFSRMSR